MRVVVITGLSGSGKSTAIRALEDLGFYAIDNLPIGLLDKLVELLGDSGEIEKLALVVDARAAQYSAEGASAGELSTVPHALEVTRQAGHDVDLVFLDASDDVLERRYSETRRRHPLSADGSVQNGIAIERGLLDSLRQYATSHVDTSQLSPHDLKRRIQHGFAPGTGSGHELSVTVLSFGFKHGVPVEADLMFDVRFLPNPYFVDKLRSMTGEDPEVADYVLERSQSSEFLEKTKSLLEFLLPEYESEGKAYLTIAVGCTGGRHRSVAVAVAVSDWLRKHGRRVQLRHRDVARSSIVRPPE